MSRHPQLSKKIFRLLSRVRLAVVGFLEREVEEAKPNKGVALAHTEEKQTRQ
jgi:hypothetical protein